MIPHTQTANGHQQTINLHGTNIPLSRPYDPPSWELIGLDRALQDLLASWLCLRDEPPLGALLIGLPGVGKNQLVYEAARLTGKKLYMRLGGESLRDDDFAVDFAIDSEAGLERVLSPLVTAMITGDIFFMDEIGEVRETALSKLLSVLDDRGAIEVPMLGWVKAHPGFRFVAAMNTSDERYHPLPEKLRQRLWVVRVAPPSREIIHQILLARFPDFKESLDELLGCFWSLWKETQHDRPPTPREVLHVFGQAMKHAALEAHRNISGEGTLLSLRVEDPAMVSLHHLTQVFASLSSDNLSLRNA